MSVGSTFNEIVGKLTPRCTEKISNAFSFAASPFTGAMDYLADTAASGEARSARGFAQAAWGGDGKGLLDFKVGGKAMRDEEGNVLKDAKGNVRYEEGKGPMTLNGGKIATTAGGLGLGYRFLSGGGVYRDKDGNTDIAGVPFV